MKKVFAIALAATLAVPMACLAREISVSNTDGLLISTAQTRANRARVSAPAKPDNATMKSNYTQRGGMVVREGEVIMEDGRAEGRPEPDNREERPVQEGEER